MSFLLLVFILGGCAQIPENLTSLYFDRLLQAMPADDYAPYELLEPRSPNDEQHVVADLVADGFEPQLNAGSAKQLGYIECEDFPFVKVGGSDQQFRYYLRLFWGSLFSEVFYIDVYRDIDCELLSVTGARYRRTM